MTLNFNCAVKIPLCVRYDAIGEQEGELRLALSSGLDRSRQLHITAPSALERAPCTH